MDNGENLAKQMSFASYFHDEDESGSIADYNSAHFWALARDLNARVDGLGLGSSNGDSSGFMAHLYDPRAAAESVARSAAASSTTTTAAASTSVWPRTSSSSAGVRLSM